MKLDDPIIGVALMFLGIIIANLVLHRDLIFKKRK